MKYINVVIILFIIIFPSITSSKNIVIKYKIESEIITNQDILNEIKYLVAFNNDLKILPKSQLLDIAVRSKIREKIKLIEITKYFELDKPNKELEKLVIDNLLANLNLKNTEEIDNFMKVNQISFSDISLKYKVDLFWNKMIYDKYVSKISINKNELRNRILSQTNSDFIEEYFLSEILFEINENENFKNKHNKIVNSIKNENFKVAAGNFSISNSALKGGEIGWVKKTQLSQKILDKINNLDIGDITEPFAVGNGFLIIKIVDKKKTKIKIDVDKELQNLIEKETDKQLALYSSNLFKKIKNNTYINEQ